MSFKHEIDGITLEAIVNYDSLKKNILDGREDYQEDFYIFNKDYSSSYLTEEEYNTNIDNTIKALNVFTKEIKIKEAIEKFPKKKDGTFKKNQTLILYENKNTYTSDEEYGYRYPALRFKAVDHKVIEMQYISLVAGW